MICKYKISFTKIGDSEPNLQSCIIEREGWKRSHFMKNENRDVMVDEAMKVLGLSDKEITTYKIEIL